VEKVLVYSKENLSVLVHKSSGEYPNAIYVPTSYHAIVFSMN